MTVIQWPIGQTGTSGGSVSYQQDPAGNETSTTSDNASNLRMAGPQETTADTPLSAYNIATFWFSKAPKLSVVKALSVQMSSEILSGNKKEKFTVSAYPMKAASGSRLATLKPQKLKKC
jgi:hypothetical protein